MDTKTLIAFVALALCVQYSQASRQLLADVTCGVVSPAPACDTGFEIKSATTVANTTNAAVLTATCCVANAAKNCSEIANLCPVDHVLKPSGGLVAANKTWGEAQTQCCEPKFTTETCQNTTATCSPGQYSDGAVSLTGIVKSNTTAITAACCKPIPACATADCPNTPWAVGNTSVIPSSNVAAIREAECCVLPENATCSNWAAKTNVSEAVEFNCTLIASFPAKENNAAISISKLTKAAATVACCDAVYLAGATCANIDFNCTEVPGFEADAKIPSNTTLKGVLKVNEFVAAECCAKVQIPVAEDNSTTNATTKKNSAGAKAVSFGVSALALLAMLLL